MLRRPPKHMTLRLQDDRDDDGEDEDTDYGDDDEEYNILFNHVPITRPTPTKMSQTLQKQRHRRNVTIIVAIADAMSPMPQSARRNIVSLTSRPHLSIDLSNIASSRDVSGHISRRQVQGR